MKEEKAEHEDKPIEEEYPERDLKPTVEALESLAEESNDDNMSLSQGDLLASEIKRVNQFKKTSSLEEYLLKKYRVGLVQRELGDMKSDARAALVLLSKEQKLYRIAD